jgi:hypothetical protein
MLIIITRDANIMNWANSAESGAAAWAQVKQLSAGTQSEADSQLQQLLKVLKSDEPLCITGHGNDTEVGDEGAGAADWTWTADRLAQLLGGLATGYKGPMLMEVCADSVTDFAAHLVVSLESRRKLNGVWVYGYNKSVSVTHPFPAPSQLGKNVELVGKQVNFKSQAKKRAQTPEKSNFY